MVCGNCKGTGEITYLIEDDVVSCPDCGGFGWIEEEE